MASNQSMTEGLPQQSQPTDESSLPDAALRPGTRILCIAEDVGSAGHDVIPTLVNVGLDVHLIATDPSTAVIQLDNCYQLVLFDIGSANGSGYKLCARVRRLSPLPLMLVLRGAARDEILRGFRSGADAYILAPFDPREFLARVSGLLRRESPHPAHTI